MKNILYLFIFLIILLVSCTSEANDTQTKSIIKIDTTIANYQNFYYYFENLKNNEGAGITVKPKYSEICEVFTDSTSGKIIFKYKAKSNYNGKDFVELYKSNSSLNASIKTVDTIRVTFTITGEL